MHIIRSIILQVIIMKYYFAILIFLYILLFCVPINSLHNLPWILQITRWEMKERGNMLWKNTRTIKGIFLYFSLFLSLSSCYFHAVSISNSLLISYGNPGEIYDIDRLPMAQSISPEAPKLFNSGPLIYFDCLYYFK